MLFPLLQEWPASLRTGESVLVVVRGEDVVLLNPLPVGDVKPLAISRPLAQQDLPAAMAARGRTGIVEGVDYRGEPVLAAVGRVPGTPWYLIAKQDLAVIDQPIWERGAGHARLGGRSHRAGRRRAALLLAQPRGARACATWSAWSGSGAAWRPGTRRSCVRPRRSWS